MGQPTLLIVDNDSSVIGMLEMTLGAAGYTVYHASDGLAGWDAYQAVRPDVVLTDIKMPGLDGVDLLARIKADDPEIDVVILTGHADLPSAIQAVRLGAYRYLQKPIYQITEVVQTVEEALRKRRMLLDRRLIDRFSQDLACQSSLTDFVDRFLERLLTSFAEIDVAFIALPDDQTGILTIVRAHGLPNPERLVGSQIHDQWSIGAQAARQAKPIQLDCSQLNPQDLKDLVKRGLPRPISDLVQGNPSMGALGIPIVSQDEVVGSLAVVNLRTIDAFHEHLVSLLSTLCRQAGLYLRSAKLVSDLQAQTGRLEAVLKSTVDGMIVIDSQGKVVLTNPRFEGMFDGGHQGSDKSRLVDELQTCLVGKDAAYFDFSLAPPPDGDQTVLEVYAARVDRDGKPIDIVASLRDVTLLRKLDRAQADILRYTKHEVGAPIAVINAYVHNLLKLGSRISEEQRAATLHQIAEQAAEVDQLLSDLLEYPQLKQQLVNEYRERLDLGRIASQLTQEIALLAAEKEIVFSVDVKPDLWVNGGQSLKRALRNLLVNALKFTPAGGSIWWRVNGEGTTVKIEIEDTGVGVPVDELERVFEPYFRASTAGEAPGTGLGLSVVRDIVEAHGGQISVESQVGRGSRFTVTLPALSQPS